MGVLTIAVFVVLFFTVVYGNPLSNNGTSVHKVQQNNKNTTSKPIQPNKNGTVVLSNNVAVINMTTLMPNKIQVGNNSRENETTVATTTTTQRPSLVNLIPKPVREILPKCGCNALTCECCVFAKFPNRPQRSACIRFNANVNDLGVNAETVIDGNIISTHALGPSNFPICVAYPPVSLCFVANNIFLEQGKIKICSTLSVKIAGATLFNGKLPCVGWENGQVAVSQHEDDR